MPCPQVLFLREFVRIAIWKSCTVATTILTVAICRSVRLNIAAPIVESGRRSRFAVMIRGQADSHKMAPTVPGVADCLPKRNESLRLKQKSGRPFMRPPAFVLGIRI